MDVTFSMIKLVLYCLQSWVFRQLACCWICGYILGALLQLNGVYIHVLFGWMSPPFGLFEHLCELIIVIQTWMYVDDLFREHNPLVSRFFRITTAIILFS